MADTRTPLEKLIDAAVRCTVCGAQGAWTCDCWQRCRCGWSYRTGEQCDNPKHSKPSKRGGRHAR